MHYQICASRVKQENNMNNNNNNVLPHMSILAHTRMRRPIRLWDIPYAYGPILCPIRVWASHMSMHA